MKTSVQDLSRKAGTAGRRAARPARCIVFQTRSDGVFLSGDNLRGVLGLLPEMGLVAIGVTILMICGEFDLSVGSVFALTPMAMAHPDDRRRALRRRRSLLGLASAAAIGFVNGFITLTFAIPSFIATLGMLFIVRSLTVVISGGFPPLLPDDLPTWIFTQFVGPGGLFRMSFIWFAGDRVLAAAMLSLHQFRQLDQGDRRPPRGRGRDGHPGRRGQDRLLHALLGAGRLRRHHPGAAARLAAALDRRRDWSCRRSPRR